MQGVVITQNEFRNSYLSFWNIFFSICLMCKVINYKQYSGKNHSKKGFFRGFHPLFQPLFSLDLKVIWFFWKFDLCYKFEYSISKIGESPTKCISSFPNRDHLLILKNRFIERFGSFFWSLDLLEAIQGIAFYVVLAFSFLSLHFPFRPCIFIFVLAFS